MTETRAREFSFDLRADSNGVTDRSRRDGVVLARTESVSGGLGSCPPGFVMTRLPGAACA